MRASAALKGKLGEMNADRLKQRGDGRSSHWHQHYQHDSWKSGEFGVRQGLGIFIPRSARRVLAHHLFQLPLLLYGRHYKAFWQTWRAGRRIAQAHDRVFDFDDLRAVLALSCARQYVQLDPSDRHTIAVIGDGYGRLANLILATLPKSLVVLLNLPPSLEMDLASLGMVRSGLRILQPDRAEDLHALPLELNVIAIPAEKSSFLQSLKLDGAFNTSSMQEMELSVIRNYFHLLRTSRGSATWFYCANATEKKWADGSVIRFADYPWSPHDRIVLDEICPWAHRGYDIIPPRYVQRPFRIQHRLAFLHKEQP